MKNSRFFVAFTILALSLFAPCQNPPAQNGQSVDERAATGS
jgi:hypothetical protein